MKPNNTQWNPDLYNQEGDFVSQYGKDLVSLLNPKNHERILDLGCGTGKLTNEISQSCAQVIGIDSSVDMIHEAKKT